MAKQMRFAYLLDFYGRLLSPRQRQIADLYYNRDLSLGEIATVVGITRQGALDSLKRAQARLDASEERLGLAARFSAVKKGCGEILRVAASIRGYNREFVFSEEIDGWIDEIERQVGLLEE